MGYVNCSNLQVSVSNLCYLIKLLKLFPTCQYSPFVVLSTFVISSNLYHLIKLLSFSHPFLFTHFCVIYTSYKCTCCTHHKHNSFFCLIVRTLSALIYVSNPPGVFGHRAILTMGGSDRSWGFPHRTNRNVLQPPIGRSL